MCRICNKHDRFEKIDSPARLRVARLRSRRAAEDLGVDQAQHKRKPLRAVADTNSVARRDAFLAKTSLSQLICQHEIKADRRLPSFS